MNFVLHTILASVVATSAMTAFSYAVSYIFKHNYREPVLLNSVLNQLPYISISPSANALPGWGLHYFTGLIFTTAFVCILQFTNLELSILFGLAFGLFAGIAGVIIWKLILSLHPYSPRIDTEGYFAQLLVAHIIFGWALAIFYLLV